MRTGRIGTATGVVQTISPPNYCVTWDDDGAPGAIRSHDVMRCVDEPADDGLEVTVTTQFKWWRIKAPEES